MVSSGPVAHSLASRVVVLAAIALASCAPSPSPAASPGSGSEAASPPSTATSTVPVAPPPPPATASEVMAAARSAFDACYARARAANSLLGRTAVKITYTVDETGTAKTADLQYRNRFDDAAKDCMRDAALSVRFPASMQGTQTGTITFAP
jgi:hypothetical protein